MKKLLLSTLCLCSTAWASTTTLTGSINDAQGNGLNGTLVMQLPTMAQDITTNTQVTAAPVYFRVVNGSITGGAPLYDVANLRPTGLYYITAVYDSAGRNVFNGNFYVTGATFNLGAATPTNITTSNVSFANPVFTGLTVNGSATITNGLTASNVNGIRYIDGTTYAKTAAGINAAIQATPLTGGTIILPAGGTPINATIVIDRPIQLLGQNGNYNGRGTQLQWTGGASPLITILGASGTSSGTTLQDINLDNTGTGTIGIDIDNNAVFVTLVNVTSTPSVPFSTAGIRIGNNTAGSAVFDVYFDRVIMENNPINLLLLRCFHFVANRSRFVNASTNEIQIGDATHVVDSAHFYAFDIEPSTTTNVTEVNILNGSDITFADGFAEQTGASSFWLDCPATATACNNISMRGSWMQSNSGAQNIFHVNLASATLSVESSEANNFPASSFWVKNDSARRIYLNNLVADNTNLSFLTSNANASFGPGNSGSNIVGPYINDPITFRGDVTFSTNSSVASRWLFSRGTAPSASGESCYDDGTALAILCSFNAGSYFKLAQVITATSAAFATATTAGTCVQNTTAVTGAATTMSVSVSPASTPGVGAQWSAFVSSAGNVTINECAVATSAGGTIAFNIRVFP